MTDQKPKLITHARFGPSPYLIGLKGQSGELDIKQFKSKIPQHVISAVLDNLALKFGEAYQPLSEPFSFTPAGLEFVSDYSQAGVYQALGMSLQQMVLSPDLPITLEIQPSRKQRDAYVMVKVVALRGEKALCRTRYKAHWLEIELERKSVEQQGLRDGDTFEWIPNEEGVLHGPDIRNHPRRENIGETERTQKAFDDLAKMVQQAGG